MGSNADPVLETLGIWIRLFWGDEEGVRLYRDGSLLTREQVVAIETAARCDPELNDRSKTAVYKFVRGLNEPNSWPPEPEIRPTTLNLSLTPNDMLRLIR